jgi:hypothetical protein
VILLGQHLRLLRDELLGAQPEPKETLCTYSKLLKDTLRQLVSAMLSAVLKQRVSSNFLSFLLQFSNIMAFAKIFFLKDLDGPQ